MTTTPDTTIIDTYDRNPDPEVMAQVTLDAPRYLPADPRYISRLLKAEGLTRAEAIPRSSGDYTWGYNISGNELSIYKSTQYNKDESQALIDQAVEILRTKGFVVTGQGGSRSIFKLVTTPDDDFIFWANFHTVHVGVGDKLVLATRVPAFKQERDARDHRAKQARAQQVRDAQTAQEAREAFLAALKAAGLDTLGQSTTRVTVDLDVLQAWLKDKGVAL